MELLQKALGLAFAFTILVEATPLWWKSMGYGLVTTLFASWGLYTIRLMIEVSLLRLGFSVMEWAVAVVFRLLPVALAGSIRRRLGWIRHGPLWQKVASFLRRLGYFGLFAAGWIPVPGPGMAGPFIYNLEQLHKPWYRYDNFAFACLLGGGLMKMVLVVGAIYPEEVIRLWHSFVR